MKTVLFLPILFIFVFTLIPSTAKSQNRVFENSESVNYGVLDLSTVSGAVNKWTTARTANPGVFANYGSATFILSDQPLDLLGDNTRWVDGYVKHYATEGNTTHIYPVGDKDAAYYLKTEHEIVGKSISVAWKEGNPNLVEDITAPDPCTHLDVGGVNSIITLGQWDWISTLEGAEAVFVSVKIPDDGQIDPNNPSYRLAGWYVDEWRNLSGNEVPVNGIVSGYVRKGCSAITLGKGFSPVKSIATTGTTAVTATNFSMKGNAPLNGSFFNVYPNPVQKTGLTLNYNISYSGAAKLILYDMMGKTVLNQTIIISEGTNSQTVDTNKLSAGFYTLEVNDVNNNPLIKPKKIILQ